MIKNLQILADLSPEKQLTFAYLICKRLAPNYAFFSKQFGFGNTNQLNACIDFIYNHIIKNDFDENAAIIHLHNIDAITPFPENFNTILASSALDACSAILDTLIFITDQDFNLIENISSYATDSVDMYVQDLENLDNNTDEDFEKKITNHPLMVKEIKTQNDICISLKNTDVINEASIKSLLLSHAPQGNLGLN
ncbi:uncharacterized protein DUF416 [Chitinophaga dinghuensis]|uniref:Uncharacterized protein DUF416 n=1 Tax=Chitinophaga dinghuensis TaxID=1539050 RepID=A0A327VSA0_9BACT|nr:DUF416 family protein [Chitinophaga dinghuensis]RAJ77247.1 uncharacterized protein DUF416 [Chitinophaga dinghuensis]